MSKGAGGCPSAVEATKLLGLLGDRPQHRYQLLRACIATRVMHLKRQVHPRIFTEAAGALTDAIDEEIANLVWDGGSETGGSLPHSAANGPLPPPRARRLPDDARLRAMMPTGWGGLGISPLEYEEACAANVAATATSASAMHAMIAKMGGWAGPNSTGYKWAQQLLVQATTIAGGADSGDSVSHGPAGSISSGSNSGPSAQALPELPLQAELRTAYEGIRGPLEWFERLQGEKQAMARSMTSSFMLVAGRDDPIEVKLPLPPSTSDLRADAGKKNSSSREARLRCCCCAGTSIGGSGARDLRAALDKAWGRILHDVESLALGGDRHAGLLLQVGRSRRTAALAADVAEAGKQFDAAEEAAGALACILNKRSNKRSAGTCDVFLPPVVK